MLENVKHELVAMIIATLWWIVRNIFANERDIFMFFKSCVWSWLLWLLAFWVVPHLTDVQEIQHATIYVTWLIAPRLVTIIDHYLPLLIKKRIWE